MKNFYLAIETSCDETCAAVIDSDGKILSNSVFSQANIHSQFGGVLPDVASKNHSEKIMIIIENSLKNSNIKINNINKIFVTNGPGLINCLMIGVITAKTIGYVNKIPVYPINHIEGHIASCFIENEITFPSVCLIVSGGHTNLYFISNLKKKELVKIDDGALIANDGQDPPALITKSDGSYMYLTTDIGTIIYREKNFSPDHYIYVVDQRQKNHFNQLFKLVDYFKLSKSKFEHVPFGTVNDKKGKPMKTRDGKNYKLIELYSDLINKLSENNLDRTIVSTLAKSVLTYSDLVTKRTSNYIFDIDKFTNVSGKSAIFIQYSQVRAKKLITQSHVKSQLRVIGNDERDLVIEILKFSHFFKLALETNEPHHLAEYAYNLCHEFNKFYTNNKIFSEDINEDLKLHRLYIVEIFYQTITNVFNCLGIEPVSEM